MDARGRGCGNRGGVHGKRAGPASVGIVGETCWRLPSGSKSDVGKRVMGSWVGPCTSGPLGKELNSDFQFY
jgi:hypothetical protein